ncbi:PKD domain-containing protein [Aquimarina algicola]|uniref:PKD domain-containing protein n=1 Tax=Aquimarina algicola TaxID=2589995 RepID=A0A504JNE0_9FLAO|nr:PKD domain-containing protein [Aquimarina algicola]TPN89243.1 PKD domain-containing protein [Aquimarina algicola]
MKRIITIILLTLVLGCAKEEAVPVIVDFDFEVFNEDYSIPVQIVFFNNTEGAEEYEWQFEGGVPSRSLKRNPGLIKYDTAGTYVIKLTASNIDGSIDTKTVEIQIDAPVLIDFDAINQVDNFSPATFKIENNASGANSFLWTFEGGVPETSTEENPGEVVFEAPGDHMITLQISNGRETYDLQKTITVAPFLVADFEYIVAFEDDDFQVPVKAKFNNTSVSGTSYSWNFEGAIPNFSSEKEPEVTFTTTGIQNVTLTATNGKDTKRITKQIEIFPNTNMRELNDIKLGINTAHNTNTVGSFYSIATREVYTADQIIPQISENIDLVFYGLNSMFNTNSFVTPDDLDETTFVPLSNPKNTIFINSQELCNCRPVLTVAQYDAMENDLRLQSLNIIEKPSGLQDFDNMIVPRIVLFKTQEGKKGAIKIKEYVNQGPDSYTLIDIKVQKEVR